MKNMLCLTVCALSLLAFASTAHSGKAEAKGEFDFGLAGATGTVTFNSKSDDGSVQGEMTFTATVGIGDPEGNGDTTSSTVTVGVPFDCMLANENRAVMSGQVTSPADSPYLGQQAILVVEDKVAGISPDTDAFSWGVYKPNFVNLTATDYDFCPAYTQPDNCEEGCPPPPDCLFDGEVIDDHNVPGALPTWVTADAELYPCPLPTEENPNPSCPTDPNGLTAGITTTPLTVDCESFPLSSYPLNLISPAGNKIEVKISN